MMNAEIPKRMTLEMAKQVKAWRCGDPPDEAPIATWRSVALTAFHAWGKPEWLNAGWENMGYQPDGWELCEQAAVMLGEDSGQ
jgi:hypothetical protein